MGPASLDSQGGSTTYINEGGDVVRDLRANDCCQLESQIYEALIKLVPERRY